MLGTEDILASLFSSNCSVIKPRRSLSGIPWESASPMDRDLIWLLALPSSMDTHGKGYSQRLAQLTLPQALLSLSQVLTYSCAGFFCPVPANSTVFWCLRRVTSGPRSKWICLFSSDLRFSKEKVCVIQVSTGVCCELTGSNGCAPKEK